MDSLTWAQMASYSNERKPLRFLLSRSSLLVLVMLLSIVTIGALSVWDVQRRNAESLDDFGRHQERLARSIARQLAPILDDAETLGGQALQRASAGVRELEETDTWVALLWPPTASGFLTTDGKPTPDGLLKDAVQAGHGYVRVHKNIAPAIGLPRRTAVAGLTSFIDARGRPFRVAVVATARRARDRAEEASGRAFLSVIIAAGAVLALGGLALHWQRQELRTQNALAVEEARRRREAELERASRAATLGTLAMGITHELSTPLSIVAARAEQLRSRPQLDDRMARSVEVISEQAARMEQVIRGILGLVRDQAPIADRLAPEDVCQGAVALVQHRFAETGVALIFDDSPEAALPLLRGDQRLLEQALVNLLLNACDACAPGGHVELRVLLHEQQILFRVTDDGAGISKEAAARAMEPFFTTKPVGKGAGLGLAVTHEIIKSHRGSLRIGPQEAGGTCAEIVLPQAEETVAHAS